MHKCSHLCNPRQHSSHAPNAETVFNKEPDSALTAEPLCSWRLPRKLRRLVPTAENRSPPGPNSVQNAGKKCDRPHDSRLAVPPQTQLATTCSYYDTLSRLK